MGTTGRHILLLLGLLACIVPFSLGASRFVIRTKQSPQSEEERDVRQYYIYESFEKAKGKGVRPFDGPLNVETDNGVFSKGAVSPYLSISTHSSDKFKQFEFDRQLYSLSGEFEIKFAGAGVSVFMVDLIYGDDDTEDSAVVQLHVINTDGTTHTFDLKGEQWISVPSNEGIKKLLLQKKAGKDNIAIKEIAFTPIETEPGHWEVDPEEQSALEELRPAAVDIKEDEEIEEEEEEEETEEAARREEEERKQRELEKQKLEQMQREKEAKEKERKEKEVEAQTRANEAERRKEKEEQARLVEERRQEEEKRRIEEERRKVEEARKKVEEEERKKSEQEEKEKQELAEKAAALEEAQRKEAGAIKKQAEQEAEKKMLIEEQKEMGIENTGLEREAEEKQRKLRECRLPDNGVNIILNFQLGGRRTRLLGEKEEEDFAAAIASRLQLDPCRFMRTEQTVASFSIVLQKATKSEIARLNEMRKRGKAEGYLLEGIPYDLEIEAIDVILEYEIDCPSCSTSSGTEGGGNTTNDEGQVFVYNFFFQGLLSKANIG